MNKPLYGLLLGVIVGAVDGLSAWLTPAVRPAILTIVIVGAFKSAMVGLLAGFFARKVHSVPMGLLFGGALGALFAYGIASMPAIDGSHYYAAIMIPGTIAGLILGYATQTQAEAAKSRAARAEMLSILMLDSDVTQRIIRFVAELRGRNPDGLAPSNRLLQDLGIDGDDAVELLTEYAEIFDVEMGEFVFSKYFSGEPTSFSIFQIFKRQRASITIHNLVESARRGRWSDPASN